MSSIKDLSKKTKKYVAILLLVVLGAFAYLGYALLGIQTTHVDGESMAPTLDNGQLLFVNTKEDTYKFGDIVVINSKEKGQITKRLIGLPGDTIEFKNHMIYRNKKLVSEFHSKKAMKNMEMPNELEFKIKLKKGKNPQYYVMGDNLSVDKDGNSVSVDSRQMGYFISKEILGKVYFH